MPKKTPQEMQRERMLEAYREQIREEELLARMNKATWEKMYYFIEGTKLIPTYGELVKQQQDLREKQVEKADQIIASANLEVGPDEDEEEALDPKSEPGSIEFVEAQETKAD